MLVAAANEVLSNSSSPVMTDSMDLGADDTTTTANHLHRHDANSSSFAATVADAEGRRFSSPKEERINSKTNRREALCHKCGKWIENQSPRDKEVLVPEIYWYKHAQKCHHTGGVGNNNNS
nr:8963_t:CDS:2 [Entrophospora candida]